MDTIRPKSVKEVKPGVYVFDFGVNVAGWAKLQAEGPRGTEVTLVYGEKLHDDGTVDIDQGHIYAQIQTDRYILSGEGVETWEPKLGYKGYQYVQVSGYPGEPTLDSLEGRVIHTSVASTGEFSTPDPLLNQMNENVRRAYLNNLLRRSDGHPCVGEERLDLVTLKSWPPLLYTTSICRVSTRMGP